ncbi:MAG: sulfur carrier protein ThiS adenylyltransferase ThiF [Eubacteriales bacterium]|nr:sulfur carrier protein ThiS adenylyltransferase ThiF [Eubacteriales bacterium]
MTYDFYGQLKKRMPSAAVDILRMAHVHVFGLGGLGSQAATLLVRCGVGHLTLIDGDRVDGTNLHRQQYTIADIGNDKTEALAAHLRAVHPDVRLHLRTAFFDAASLSTVLAGATHLIEAVDDARLKADLLTYAMKHRITVASGNGMAGLGSVCTLRVRYLNERTVLCGDEQSDVATAGALAAGRVSVCAGMQAHEMIRMILREKGLSYE